MQHLSLLWFSQTVQHLYFVLHNNSHCCTSSLNLGSLGCATFALHVSLICATHYAELCFHPPFLKLMCPGMDANNFNLSPCIQYPVPSMLFLYWSYRARVASTTLGGGLGEWGYHMLNVQKLCIFSEALLS